MSDLVHDISVAVRLDPEHRGIGYFEASALGSEEALQTFFNDLGLQVLEVWEFAADYGIKLQAPDLEVTVSNDEGPFSDPEVAAMFEFDYEFTVFSLESKNLNTIEKFIAKLASLYDIIVLEDDAL